MKSKSLTQLICTIYLFVFFVIYPLYQKDHYYQMGVNKYYFYLWSTVIFLVLIFISIITDPKRYKSGNNNKKASNKKKNQVNDTVKEKISFFEKIKAIVNKMPTIEKCVWLYLLFAIISFVFGIDKDMGFWGADGWQMGLLVQCLMIGSFFVFARFWEYDVLPWVFSMIGSFIVFIIGILNRFHIDPLGNYEGLEEHYVVEFLSTIGQSSWYGAFLCTVFPIGIGVYYFTNNSKVKKISIIYLIISFMSLVTQNSDSAYTALAGILLVLFWLSFENKDYLIKFVDIILIMSGSFSLIGAFEKLFFDRLAELDTISLNITMGIYMPVIFIIFLLIRLLLSSLEKKGLLNKLYNGVPIKKIRAVFFSIIALVVVAVITFIILNTKEKLNKLFGGSPLLNNYLYFDDRWGNFRGITWKTCAKIFKEFPIYRMLIGIGPDSLEAYANYIPDYREMIVSIYGEENILSCAHNEFFNSLLCYGLLGGISYVSIFISSIISFVKKSKALPVLIIGAVSIASYCMYNIFCYQTICCTPFLFVILGCCENIMQKKR